MPREPIRRDHGSSLVEAVVALSISGFVLICVADVMWADVRLGALLATRSATESIVDYAVLTARILPFSPCPHLDSSYIDELLVNFPAQNRTDHIVTIGDFEYWQPSSSTWVPARDITAPECSTSTDMFGPWAIQHFVVTATSRSGLQISRSCVKTRAGW